MSSLLLIGGAVVLVFVILSFIAGVIVLAEQDRG
jgi:hypothetical protein